MSSIKRNFALNLVNTISGLLFPLVTFPYASRILLADGIGQVQFFQSIINYIALCTALGIPMYAVREIARVRDDKIQCSRITIEILLLHSLLTLVGYVIVFVLITTVSKVQVDIPLFLLLSVNLFFTAIGALWFYQGIEDFKYITIRTLIVRSFSLIALFLFVKDKSDLFYYAAISVVAEVGGNVFNFIRLRRFIDFHCLHIDELHPLKHLKPALKIFILNIVISIYINLDSVMLGFLKNETAVGYYVAATRITKSILGIVSSLSLSILPRFSNMIANKQRNQFNALSIKAIDLILCLSLPMAAGLFILSDVIIDLFCGSAFREASLTLKIISPIILFIGCSGILTQILFAVSKEKLIIYSTLVGAITNLLLNLFLIPVYSQDGAAIATSIAEFLVVSVMLLCSYKIIAYRNYGNLFRYVSGTFLVVIFLILLRKYLTGFYCLSVGVIFSMVLYYAYLYVRKDQFVCQIQSFIYSKIKK